jgi:hypothetical protein
MMVAGGGFNVRTCEIVAVFSNGKEERLATFHKTNHVLPIELATGADRQEAEKLITEVANRFVIDGYRRLGKGQAWYSQRFAKGEPAQEPTPAVQMSGTDPELALERLVALREKGLITDDEFAAKRREILARL